jgi:short-subunit dehydrogenase
VADFSLNEDEYIRIFESLDDLDIGVLGMGNNFFFKSLTNTYCSINYDFSLLMAVNNVGTAGGIPNIFECMTRKQVWTMLMVNVCAATSMTHHFLPKMKIKKRGLIVNISSLTCLSPTPYGMLYGASKVTKNIAHAFS